MRHECSTIYKIYIRAPFRCQWKLNTTLFSYLIRHSNNQFQNGLNNNAFRRNTLQKNRFYTEGICVRKRRLAKASFLQRQRCQTSTKSFQTKVPWEHQWKRMLANVGTTTTINSYRLLSENPSTNIEQDSNDSILSSDCETWNSNSNASKILKGTRSESLCRRPLQEGKMPFKKGPPSLFLSRSPYSSNRVHSLPLRLSCPRTIKIFYGLISLIPPFLLLQTMTPPFLKWTMLLAALRKACRALFSYHSLSPSAHIECLSTFSFIVHPVKGTGL